MLKSNIKFILLFSARASLFSLIVLLFYAISLHFIGGGSLVYYRGIVIIIIIFFLFLAILLFIKNDFSLNLPSLSLAISLTFLFHTTIPVILDRSISIQVIGSLKDKPMSITTLNDRFLKGYVDGYSTVCRRLDEQLRTGNIVMNNDIITITNKGKFMQKIFYFIAEFLRVENHYIRGSLDENYIHHYDLINQKCTTKTTKDEKFN